MLQMTSRQVEILQLNKKKKLQLLHITIKNGEKNIFFSGFSNQIVKLRMQKCDKLLEIPKVHPRVFVSHQASCNVMSNNSQEFYTNSEFCDKLAAAGHQSAAKLHY